MSFNSNDTIINLGNYEEYFVLYMDNELTTQQRQMVEAFLAAHPDLQAEFELIKGLQLQPEDVHFSKENLLSDKMKLNLAEEDLLLYLDNELPAAEAKSLQTELAADENLNRQYQLLLQTRLDASEVVVFPNKQQLYRRQTGTLAPWMRAAAAVIVIASLGVAYFSGGSSVSPAPAEPVAVKANRQPAAVAQPKETPATQQTLEKNNEVAAVKSIEDVPAPAKVQPEMQEKIAGVPRQKNTVAVPEPDGVVENVIAYTESANRNTSVHSEPFVSAATLNSGNKEFINNASVTSGALPRNTIITAAVTTVPENTDVADNKRGSLKGFLRKATRVIEKRTGIEATNDDEELLIGAFAVKLK